MKTIGLIGGLSWESTATYYAEINRGVREVLGGLHSAKLLLHSFDFAEIAAFKVSSADTESFPGALTPIVSGCNGAGALGGFTGGSATTAFEFIGDCSCDCSCDCGFGNFG
jgi:aspartate racemase